MDPFREQLDEAKRATYDVLKAGFPNGLTKEQMTRLVAFLDEDGCSHRSIAAYVAALQQHPNYAYFLNDIYFVLSDEGRRQWTLDDVNDLRAYLDQFGYSNLAE